MVADRQNDILRCERLAIVESHPAAQFEHPLLGAVGMFEAFGQLRHDIPLGIDLGQIIRHGAAESSLSKGVGPARRIKVVGCGSVREPKASETARFSLRAGGADIKLVGCHHRKACCQRKLHEISPRDLPTANRTHCHFQFVFKFRHCSSPCWRRQVYAVVRLLAVTPGRNVDWI